MRYGTAEKLREARRILRQPLAWIKRDFRRYNENRGITQYCALGACYEVGLHNNDLLREAIEERYGKQFVVDGATSVIDFNDHPMTRKKDVLAVFDRAIELASR